jgi:hypothetical protein
MLYAVQGPTSERNNSLTLSMQLVELCKASGAASLEVSDVSQDPLENPKRKV